MNILWKRPQKKNNNNEELEKHLKDWKPGTILHCRHGVGMEINDFYIITKRNNSMVYYKALGNKIISGDAQRGVEEPDKNKVYSKEYHARAGYWDSLKECYIKVGYHQYATLWDRKPKHFDKMD